MSTSRFLVATGLLAFVWGLFFHIALFDAVPHVTDEISHLFQAKILSTGSWHAPAPPCPASFFQHHIYITTNGKWFSIYPPGHATLLAAFGLFGAKGLLSPLSFAISTAAVGWLAHAFLRPWSARRLTLLFAMSPLNWLLGGSFMSHFSFLACFTAGLCFFMRLHQTTSPGMSQLGWGTLAGACLGYAGLIRPQDVVLTSTMIGWVVLCVAPRTVLPILQSAFWLLPGLMIPAVYAALWNHVQYGTVLALGYAHGVETVNHLFKPTFGFHASFGPADSVAITLWTLLRMNKVLLGWPTVFLLLPFAFWPGHPNRRTLAATGAIALIVGFYFFYFYHGTEYEARFYHITLPAFLFLIIRSIDRFSAWLRIRGRDGRSIWVTLCAVSWLHVFIYYLPVYLWPRYGNGYEQASAVIHNTVRDAGVDHAVVLIPSKGDQAFRYSSGFMWNDPYLTGAVVYARDNGTNAPCLAGAFPDRTVYTFSPAADWRSGLLTPAMEVRQ